MKKHSVHLMKLLVLLFFTSLQGLAQTPTPLAANGRLRLINRQLCNEAGTPIQLRGMSSHGLQWFGNCYTASALQTLATDWGADVFRAALYVDEGGYLNDKTGLQAKVNQIVDWSGQNGMYCIIDWHILNPGNPNNHLTEAKAFFGLMARQHAGKKQVIYEICNEPNGVSWADVKSYAEQVIPVIRQYDSEAIILVGTPSWSGSPGDVTSNPLTGANAYNVMYTFHFYAGSHYTQDYIKTVLQSVPLFVSEWGTSNYSGNGGNDYTNAQAWIDLMAGNNPAGIKVSWCNWSFCDKAESSAALASGACGGGNWNNTSESGARVKNWLLAPADNFGAPVPSVAITSPANNATVTAGSSVVINASVSNATATKVEFYTGTTKLGEDATAPYSWTYSAIPQGAYSFTARAILSAENPLVSSAVRVTAAPANKAPTVSLTTPANSATFTAPASITLTASASDSDGSITNVAFYNGGTKLNEDASAPYSYVWTNVSAGTYTLTARATDNAGATTSSGLVTVTVKAGTTPPPNATADLIGPDCVAKNDVKGFELNASQLTSATNFAWWVSGSTQSVTAGAPGKATIHFGPYFTGGQVCVGVNYSAAPWYKQFCKTVSLCSSARTGVGEFGENDPGTLTVFPNPSSDGFTLLAEKDIRAIRVLDGAGRVWMQLGTQQQGQRITFGETLSSGNYLVHIQYMDKSQKSIKVLKTGR